MFTMECSNPEKINIGIKNAIPIGFLFFYMSQQQDTLLPHRKMMPLKTKLYYLMLKLTSSLFENLYLDLLLKNMSKVQR